MLNYVATRFVSFTPKLSHRLIKFRYGASKTQQTQSTTSTKPVAQGTQQGQEVVLFDFQIPARFKRKALDEQEIAYINNGGPL